MLPHPAVPTLRSPPCGPHPAVPTLPPPPGRRASEGRLWHCLGPQPTRQPTGQPALSLLTTQSPGGTRSVMGRVMMCLEWGFGLLPRRVTVSSWEDAAACPAASLCLSSGKGGLSPAAAELPELTVLAADRARSLLMPPRGTS